MSTEKKDKSMEEFMTWQINLFIQLKAKKITRAEGMKMIKEKYPVFTDDFIERISKEVFDFSFHAKEKEAEDPK